MTKVIFLAWTAIAIGCAGTDKAIAEQQPPAPVSKTATVDELDISIRDASDYLNEKIPKGSKIVILNIQSNSSDLSDYIIDELIANAVNDGFFTVVDRQQLDAIRNEQKFQLSGAVDDKDALAIGKLFGAKTIVSGAVNRLGATGYRIRIRSLEVQTAQVQGQFNRNIAESKIVNSLMESGGTVGGGYAAGSYSTGATAQTKFPKVGRWKITGKDSENWTGSNLIIEEIDEERFSGYFEWYRSGIDYSGREYFKGIYNPHLNTVVMKGYRLVDARGIGIAVYDAYLSKNGYDFESGTWGDGRGKWEAKWQK